MFELACCLGIMLCGAAFPGGMAILGAITDTKVFEVIFRHFKDDNRKLIGFFIRK